MSRPPVLALTRAEAVARIRRREALRAERLEIACDSVDAVLYRDAIALYALLKGAGAVVWRDAEGRERADASLVGAGAALLRDILAAPFLLARARREAQRLLDAAAPRRARAFRPRRALYLRSDHWFNVTAGGSVGHVRGVIEGLRAAGVETHVLASDRLAGVAEDERFTLCPPVYGLGRNLPGLPELAYDRAMAAAARRLAAAIAPDFIYQRMSFLNATGARLAAETGCPYVCEYNGSIPWMARHWDGRPALFERLALLYEEAALKTADLVVAVSAASRDELLARGVAPERVLVNPNGVDLDAYRPDIDGRETAARLGLAGKTVIGFIGSFGRWHGAEVLAEAFARLLARRGDLRAGARLLMIGDGMMRAEAEARLAAAGLSDAALFTGRIPQADGPAHLAVARILVAPHVPNRDGSPFFGSPTKLFEYMAMGRAIAASDLDQIGEILKHERTALLVPPGDAAALADALERLIDDPALCARLGAAARREAEARYGWDRHAARILDALCARLAPEAEGKDQT